MTLHGYGITPVDAKQVIITGLTGKEVIWLSKSTYFVSFRLVVPREHAEALEQVVRREGLTAPDHPPGWGFGSIAERLLREEAARLAEERKAA
jgi:hypothetical protein